MKKVIFIIVTIILLLGCSSALYEKEYVVQCVMLTSYYHTPGNNSYKYRVELKDTTPKKRVTIMYTNELYCTGDTLWISKKY